MHHADSGPLALLKITETKLHVRLNFSMNSDHFVVSFCLQINNCIRHREEMLLYLDLHVYMLLRNGAIACPRQKMNLNKAAHLSKMRAQEVLSYVPSYF